MAKPPSGTSMHIADQLCFALYGASRAIQQAYRPQLAKHDLTYPQYLCLLVLWERNNRPVSEIAAELGLDTATTTPLLQRMEKAGLVTRTRSDQDERQVIVSVTEDGAGLQDSVRSVTESITTLANDASGNAAELRDTLNAFTARLHEELTTND
ncbi:MAG: MarR family transcriptional regulator [Actinomycetota bacterium]